MILGRPRIWSAHLLTCLDVDEAVLFDSEEPAPSGLQPSVLFGTQRSQWIDTGRAVDREKSSDRSNEAQQEGR